MFEWFIDPAWGGQAWSEADSSAATSPSAPPASRPRSCSPSAPALAAESKVARTQRSKQRLLPGFARGELFATVGISHLTTSRRHLGKPVLTAEAIPGGFRLNGMSPWVTGAAAADVIVIAAMLVENDTPTDRATPHRRADRYARVTVADPLPLIGVTASSTGPVHLKSVEFSDDWLIAGPPPNVMSSGLGGEHRRLRNVDAGARPGQCRDQTFCPTKQPGAPTSPSRRPRFAPNTMAARRSAEYRPRRVRLHEGIDSSTGEQSGAAGEASGAGRGKRYGLRRRPPRRPLVPRSDVLPGVELPTTSIGRPPVRTGRNCVLMATTPAPILLAVGTVVLAAAEFRLTAVAALRRRLLEAHSAAFATGNFFTIRRRQAIKWLLHQDARFRLGQAIAIEVRALTSPRNKAHATCRP